MCNGDAPKKRWPVSDYARNQDAGGVVYPDLVYSNWLDAFFPCRIIASGGGMAFIEALYHGAAVQMRVPTGIVYRRPAGELTGQDRSSVPEADQKSTTDNPCPAAELTGQEGSR